MPFRLGSPNAIPPAHTLLAFFFSAIVGASRFAHTDWLRADKALHSMLGIPRFPGTDTIRNLFSRFTQRSALAGVHGPAGVRAAALPGIFVSLGAQLHAALCGGTLSGLGKARPA